MTPVPETQARPAEAGRPLVEPAARHDELAVLTSRAAAGDQQAQRTLLTTLVPVLLRVVRRVLGASHAEVEDVAYEAAYTFSRSLAEFRGQSSVTHFACRIAVLTAMNVRRRDASQKRARRQAPLDPEELTSSEAAPDVDAANAALVPVVRELVLTLSPPLAEALTLHVVLGYTVSEIAATSGVSAETVRSRLKLAKQALRKRVFGDPTLRKTLELEP